MKLASRHDRPDRLRFRRAGRPGVARAAPGAAGDRTFQFIDHTQPNAPQAHQ